MAYKILSIDGGGIRGAFAVQILKMIEEDLGQNLFTLMDCFAGTSTGSLIVSAMNQGYRPKQLIRFYSILGKRVFPKAKSLDGAKYDNTTLAGSLKRVFRTDPTLSDISKHLIIPACNLFDEKTKSWKMEVYDNFDKVKAKNFSLIDCTLKSCAAPIYFPSYKKCVDGGIYALNPSLIALSRVLDQTGGNRDLSEICILSIGTGRNPGGIDEEVDWNETRWMSPYQALAKHPLYSLITHMGADIPDYPLMQILKNRYLRINAELPTPIEMDDISSVSMLIESAKAIRKNSPQVWQGYLEWAQKNLF